MRCYRSLRAAAALRAFPLAARRRLGRLRRDRGAARPAEGRPARLVPAGPWCHPCGSITKFSIIIICPNQSGGGMAARAPPRCRPGTYALHASAGCGCKVAAGGAVPFMSPAVHFVWRTTNEIHRGACKCRPRRWLARELHARPPFPAQGRGGHRRRHARTCECGGVRHRHVLRRAVRRLRRVLVRGLRRQLRGRGKRVQFDRARELASQRASELARASRQAGKLASWQAGKLALECRRKPVQRCDRAWIAVSSHAAHR